MGMNMKKYILNPFSMLIIGLASGIISRLLDIYTSNLGNLFFANINMDLVRKRTLIENNKYRYCFGISTIKYRFF